MTRVSDGGRLFGDTKTTAATIIGHIYCQILRSPWVVAAHVDGRLDHTKHAKYTCHHHRTDQIKNTNTQSTYAKHPPPHDTTIVFPPHTPPIIQRGTVAQSDITAHAAPVCNICIYMYVYTLCLSHPCAYGNDRTVKKHVLHTHDDDDDTRREKQ